MAEVVANYIGQRDGKYAVNVNLQLYRQVI